MPGYVKFTGDYAKLKGMGYKFQKLFASNYMQWNLGDLRVWKKGSDITYDDYDLYDYITFVRSNPTYRTYNSMFGKKELIYSFLVSVDDKNNTTFLSFTEENKKLYLGNMDEWKEWEEDSGEPAPAYMTSKRLDVEMLAQLKELEDLGWVELVELDAEGKELKK